uniref:alpha-N-acetylgalactosaminide alpha-2,6-sialyltransferase n=1 Tax=Electrophorus electricus TaxID=8005 RepID=A0A4W4HFE7_ELEEL
SGMKIRKYSYMLLFVTLICAGIQQLMSLDTLMGEHSGQKNENFLKLWDTVLHLITIVLCFNFSVHVLQWADSFNQFKWQRLQYAPLPYGWKDVSPEVVSTTLSLLQNSSSSRLFERKSPDQCVRCAVVGNGGILNSSGQGKATDSHDYVFRVNGAITKGFKQDVGTKTSFYGFTTNTLKNSLKAYWGICYVFIPANIQDYVMLAAAIQGAAVPSGYYEGDQPSMYFGNKHSFEHFRMIHPYFTEYVTKRFLNSPYLKMRYRDFYMPSTGALMLLTVLHSCDQFSLSAYGFITQNYEGFSDHYYNAVKKPLHFYANHGLLMEGTLWQLLHSSRVMWLYQRHGKKGGLSRWAKMKGSPTFFFPQ